MTNLNTNLNQIEEVILNQEFNAKQSYEQVTTPEEMVAWINRVLLQLDDEMSQRHALLQQGPRDIYRDLKQERVKMSQDDAYWLMQVRSLTKFALSLNCHQ